MRDSPALLRAVSRLREATAEQPHVASVDQISEIV